MPTSEQKLMDCAEKKKFLYQQWRNKHSERDIKDVFFSINMTLLKKKKKTESVHQTGK